MKITLNYKSVFGRDSFYPSDAIGETIAKIGGFKSFTVHQISIMKKAGWEIDIIPSMPIKP